MTPNPVILKESWSESSLNRVSKTPWLDQIRSSSSHRTMVGGSNQSAVLGTLSSGRDKERNDLLCGCQECVEGGRGNGEEREVVKTKQDEESLSKFLLFCFIVSLPWRK